MKEFAVTMKTVEHREFVIHANSRDEARDIIWNMHNASDALDRITPETTETTFTLNEKWDDEDGGNEEEDAEDDVIIDPEQGCIWVFAYPVHNGDGKETTITGVQKLLQDLGLTSGT